MKSRSEACTLYILLFLTVTGRTILSADDPASGNVKSTTNTTQTSTSTSSSNGVTPSQQPAPRTERHRSSGHRERSHGLLVMIVPLKMEPLRLALQPKVGTNKTFGRNSVKESRKLKRLAHADQNTIRYIVQKLLKKLTQTTNTSRKIMLKPPATDKVSIPATDHHAQATASIVLEEAEEEDEEYEEKETSTKQNKNNVPKTPETSTETLKTRKKEPTTPETDEGSDSIFEDLQRESEHSISRRHVRLFRNNDVLRRRVLHDGNNTTGNSSGIRFELKAMDDKRWMSSGSTGYSGVEMSNKFKKNPKKSENQPENLQDVSAHFAIGCSTSSNAVRKNIYPPSDYDLAPFGIAYGPPKKYRRPPVHAAFFYDPTHSGPTLDDTESAPDETGYDSGATIINRSDVVDRRDKAKRNSVSSDPHVPSSKSWKWDDSRFLPRYAARHPVRSSKTSPTEQQQAAYKINLRIRHPPPINKQSRASFDQTEPNEEVTPTHEKLDEPRAPYNQSKTNKDGLTWKPHPPSSIRTQPNCLESPPMNQQTKNISDDVTENVQVLRTGIKGSPQSASVGSPWRGSPDQQPQPNTWQMGDNYDEPASPIEQGQQKFNHNFYNFYLMRPRQDFRLDASYKPIHATMSSPTNLSNNSLTASHVQPAGVAAKQNVEMQRLSDENKAETQHYLFLLSTQTPNWSQPVQPLSQTSAAPPAEVNMTNFNSSNYRPLQDGVVAMDLTTLNSSPKPPTSTTTELLSTPAGAPSNPTGASSTLKEPPSTPTEPPSTSTEPPSTLKESPTTPSESLSTQTEPLGTLTTSTTCTEALNPSSDNEIDDQTISIANETSVDWSSNISEPDDNFDICNESIHDENNSHGVTLNDNDETESEPVTEHTHDHEVPLANDLFLSSDPEERMDNFNMTSALTTRQLREGIPIMAPIMTNPEKQPQQSSDLTIRPMQSIDPANEPMQSKDPARQPTQHSSPARLAIISTDPTGQPVKYIDPLHYSDPTRPPIQATDTAGCHTQNIDQEKLPTHAISPLQYNDQTKPLKQYINSSNQVRPLTQSIDPARPLTQSIDPASPLTQSFDSAGHQMQVNNLVQNLQPITSAGHPLQTINPAGHPGHQHIQQAASSVSHMEPPLVSAINSRPEVGATGGLTEAEQHALVHEEFNSRYNLNLSPAQQKRDLRHHIQQAKLRQIGHIYYQ